jgi:hypothetical protein
MLFYLQEHVPAAVLPEVVPEVQPILTEPEPHPVPEAKHAEEEKDTETNHVHTLQV